MPDRRRQFIIPQPTTVKDVFNGQEIESDITFSEFVTVLLDQQGWEKDYKTIRSAVAIDKASRAPEGTFAFLDEEDWKRVVKFIESPPSGSTGVKPRIARQLCHYFDTILDAAVAGEETDEVG